MKRVKVEVMFNFLGSGFVVLAVIFVGLIVLIGLVFIFRLRPKNDDQVDESVRKESLPLAEGLPPEVVAVISAAVVEALGQRVRIRRIRYHHGGDASRSMGWSLQGRVTIMGSHSTKR
jgi:hypothetical protein